MPCPHTNSTSWSPLKNISHVAGIGVSVLGIIHIQISSYALSSHKLHIRVCTSRRGLEYSSRYNLEKSRWIDQDL